MEENKFFESFSLIVTGGYVHLYNNKELVNSLNVFPVPDGDTGTNMSLTMQHAVEEMTATKAKNLAESAAACSAGALMGARGNSGVILSQLIRGFAKACVGKDYLSPLQLTAALRGATDMAYKAVMKPTEGTILTVMREMTEFAEANAEKYTETKALITDLLDAGKISLQNTPNLLPVLKEAGVVDAGGKGLLLIIEGMLKRLNGEIEAIGETVKELDHNEQFDMTDNSEIKYIYCTELLIRCKDSAKREKMLIDKLIKIGDCVLVIEDGGIIKIHVHTNEPWNVMRIASVCGEFEKIKIENMRSQHEEVFSAELKQAHIETSASDVAQKQEETAESKPVFSDKHEDYVLVAVSSGEGLSAILKDLGVNYIISGGQTMNPSTEDFLNVINNTNADNYILFPNNGNIILAAQQAEAMSEKNIAVLPSKDIPQAVTALMSFDASATLSENIDNMTEAIQTVSTGEVTYAVRDTVANDFSIKTGNIIGIAGKNILCCETDVTKAAKALVEKMSGETAELITLYYGAEVKEADAVALSEELKKEYKADIEVFYGGQPLYYYIISVE